MAGRGGVQGTANHSAPPGLASTRRQSATSLTAYMPMSRGPAQRGRDTKASTSDPGLPCEVAHRNQQPGDAPGADNHDVDPVKRRADVAGLHAVREMLDRKYLGCPDDPVWRVVTERDEDTGEEQQRQDRRVDDGCRRVEIRDDRGDSEAERPKARRTSDDHDEEVHEGKTWRNIGVVEELPERRRNRHQDDGDEQRV